MYLLRICLSGRVLRLRRGSRPHPRNGCWIDHTGTGRFALTATWQADPTVTNREGDSYTDGEIRQQYENTCIGRPVGGEPIVNDEADGVRFVRPDELDRYDIHPSVRLQSGHYPADTYPLLGWDDAPTRPGER
ncbi:hypothetical protein ACIBCB_26400 [Streptomyces uncialis]|uniref:hypothetical protein n=1 Tax=Streptomyces uncialis TaxID=1048205 RepID=UPI00378E35CA